MLKLDEAIEDLYSAFGDTMRPYRLEGRPCCRDDEVMKQMTIKDRRDLSPDELAQYARKAISTQGSVDDYLYFFPRIVEIMVNDPGWIDWEVPFGKIGETEPSSWSSGRREGLESFFLKLLRHQMRLDHYDDGGTVLDELICCVGRSGLELGSFLTEVLAYPAALASFYNSNFDRLQTGTLENPFWGNTRTFDIDKLAPGLRKVHQDRRDRYEAAQAQVVAWLRSSEVEDLLFGRPNSLRG